MSTDDRTQTGIPSEVMADLEDAARYAASGVHDPEVMRRAGESMNRTREEIRRIHGVVNVAVELIREVRDED